MKCKKCGKETKIDFIIRCSFCQDEFCPDCISQEYMGYIIHACKECKAIINEEIGEKL